MEEINIFDRLGEKVANIEKAIEDMNNAIEDMNNAIMLVFNIFSDVIIKFAKAVEKVNEFPSSDEYDGLSFEIDEILPLKVRTRDFQWNRLGANRIGDMISICFFYNNRKYVYNYYLNIDRALCGRALCRRARDSLQFILTVFNFVTFESIVQYLDYVARRIASNVTAFKELVRLAISGKNTIYTRVDALKMF